LGVLVKREGETPEMKIEGQSDYDRDERLIGGIREEECMCVRIEGVMPSCVDAKTNKV
jgi:hypothetical protein